MSDLSCIFTAGQQENELVGQNEADPAQTGEFLGQGDREYNFVAAVSIPLQAKVFTRLKCAISPSPEVPIPLSSLYIQTLCACRAQMRHTSCPGHRRRLIPIKCIKLE